jgi:lethal(2) giant larvae protein
VTTAAIRKEDVVGISSLVFSEAGDAVYMSSSSELQLFTVAASRVGFCKNAKGTVVVPPENRASSEEPATETDRQADLQNRQNEREAEQNGTQARASPR